MFGKQFQEFKKIFQSFSMFSKTQTLSQKNANDESILRMECQESARLLFWLRYSRLLRMEEDALDASFVVL